MIDLIVIALVAAVVVSRFTKFKLPKDPRDPAQRRSDFDRLRGKSSARDEASNVVDITAQAAARKVDSRPAEAAPAKAADVKHLSGLAKIKALEPSFKEDAFLEGANAAYGYFYQSWNTKDEEALANLCAPGLYDRVVTDLHSAEWQPVHIDDLRDASIVSARVHGKTAVIEVRFDSTEREGEGAPRIMQRRWVLARPLGSDDPNWELESMSAGADA